MKDKENSSTCEKANLLKPINACNLVKFYLPLSGVVSHTVLSVNIMNPTLRLFPEKDISNFLLINTLFGTGAYIYTREHVKKATPGYRILFSATGALLLSFGSVLICSVLRSIIPANPVLFTITGIGTSLVIISTGKKYLTDIDDALVGKTK